MKRSLSIITLAALIIGLVSAVYGQDKPDFKILKAEVISVSEHPGKPYTIEIKIETGKDKTTGSLTIDSRCTFYKDDKQPKTIDIVKPGDKIEATYIMHQGTKVAFSIVVMPKP